MRVIKQLTCVSFDEAGRDYYSNLVIMDDIVSASSELIHLSYGFMIYRMIFLYKSRSVCMCWMDVWCNVCTFTLIFVRKSIKKGFHDIPSFCF